MSMSARAAILAATTILASAVCATQSVAEILVLRSTGPIAQRIPAGALLPAQRPIRLGAGDVLDLMSETGTWSWRGPGEFPGAAATVRTASAIVSPDLRRSRVGAVRSVEGTAGSRPNIWMIDVAQPGPVCVLNADTPLLWRKDADREEVSAISGPDGVSAEIHWAAGQSASAWPTDVPLVEGGTYRLSGRGTAAPVSIVIRELSDAPASVPAAGIALIERACGAQMDLLVAHMEPTEADAES